jgi:hypothetical protein
MTPTIGRIVHFQVAAQIPEELEPPLVPAIVTGVHDDGHVDLTVFYRSETVPTHRVREGTTERTWRWPVVEVVVDVEGPR